MKEFRGLKVMLDSKGYPMVYVPDHPEAMPSNGCAYVHRIVYHEEVGPIPEGFHVHHKNEDILDWSVDNLVLMTASKHASYHLRKNAGTQSSGRSGRKGRVCAFCWTKFATMTDNECCSKSCAGFLRERSSWKADWPALEQLEARVRSSSINAVANELGVSWHAVRKRLER